MIDRKFVFEATNPCNGKKYTNRNALVLCAKDLAVPAALEAYKAECVKLGSNPEHIESIGLLIERVKQYQLVERHVPDTELECEIARCIRGEGLED